MSKSRLHCDVPVGLAVGTSSVDFLGVPEMGECMMIIATLVLFFAAGHAIFRIWGKAAAPKATVPESEGFGAAVTA